MLKLLNQLNDIVYRYNRTSAYSARKRRRVLRGEIEIPKGDLFDCVILDSYGFGQSVTLVDGKLNIGIGALRELSIKDQDLFLDNLDHVRINIHDLGDVIEHLTEVLTEVPEPSKQRGLSI